MSTHLDIAHPLGHTIPLALDIHHPWRTANAQQDEDIVERRGLLQLGDFLPRCDVMRSDQGVIQALHCISFLAMRLFSL